MGDAMKIIDGKIQYFLENPQQALITLQNIKSKDAEINIESDILIYRSYISQQKYSIPLSEINSKTASIGLRSVRLLAKFLCNKDSRDEVIKEIGEMQTENLDVNDSVPLVMWASIYLHDNKPEQALKIVHNGESVECLALSVHALLHMNRLDLAQKTLKKMIELNEDDILTQLTIATVDLTVGGTKLREAYNVYSELAEKYRTTSNLLLNGKAAALISLGNLDEADSILQDALGRNPNDPETLVNMVVLSQAQAKPVEIVNRYLTQLKESHEDHAFVQELRLKETEFDRLTGNYSVSVPTSS